MSKDNNEASFYLGLAGSISLIIGVFAPLMSVPFAGSINYFQGGEGDGIIVLTLAGISLALVFMNQTGYLYITSAASAALIFFTFYNIRRNLGAGSQDLGGFGDLARGMIQYQWGWAFLIIGVILLFISASKA